MLSSTLIKLTAKVWIPLVMVATSAMAKAESPWWTHSLEAQSIESADVVSCRVTGSWQATQRTVVQASGLGKVDPLTPWPCHRVSADLLDGSGGKISLVIPLYGTKFDAPKGETLLVFGHKSSRGSNGNWILSADTGRQPLTKLRIEGTAETEFCALLTLPSKLKDSPGPGLNDRLLAILSTVDKSQPETYSRICRLIGSAHPDWTSRSNALDEISRVQFQPRPASRATTEVCLDEKIAAAFAAALQEAATEFERSRLLELRTRWRLPGSVSPYRASLRQLLTEPGTYSQTDDIGATWGPVEGLNSDHVAIDGWIDYPVDEWIGDLLKSKNPILRAFFLRNFGAVMNEAQRARFAQNLKTPDKKFQYEVMTILASQTGLSDQAPKLYEVVNDQMVDYPDFDEKLAFWKKRYDVRAK